MTPTIRLATRADISATSELASRYYIGNLAPSERAEGFVSVLLTREWFESAIGCDGLHVAIDGGGSLVGLMGVTPPPSGDAEVSPVIRAMMGLAFELEFDGRTIAQQNYAFRGPVLIDASARGRGLYSAFNQVCHEFYRDRYDVGVLFVAADNPRSLHTTTTKLGATVLTEFAVGEKRYHFLAFRF